MDNNFDIIENINENSTNEKENLIQDLIELISNKLIEKEEQVQEINNNEKELVKSINFEEKEQVQNKNLEETEVKEKTLVIDRFEGNFAVCENRDTLEMENIEISSLPENIKQGDLIKFKNNQYEKDEQSKEEIQNRINEKLKNLFID